MSSAIIGPSVRTRCGRYGRRFAHPARGSGGGGRRTRTAASRGLGLAAGVLVLDLGPAGQTGSHQMAQPVVRDLPGQLGNHLRPLRAWTDEGELTTKNVDDLRQLVEMRTAHDVAERRDPRILHLRPVVDFLRSTRTHRAELEDREGRTAVSDPRLPVEQRSPVRDHVTDDHHRDDHGQRDKSDECQGDVEESLDPRDPCACISPMSNSNDMRSSSPIGCLPNHCS